MGGARRTLGQNLEAACKGQPLHPWQPQRLALQLIGSHEDAAWARWGSWRLGPSPLLWHRNISTAPSWLVFSNQQQWQTQPRWLAGLRGQMPAQPRPQHWSGWIGGTARRRRLSPRQPELLQSMDGFPALVSDLAQRTADSPSRLLRSLACGTIASSAMATITLPMVPASEQQEIWCRPWPACSVLDEQDAVLIGGHTMESEARHPSRPASGYRSPSRLMAEAPVTHTEIRAGAR